MPTSIPDGKNEPCDINDNLDQPDLLSVAVALAIQRLVNDDAWEVRSAEDVLGNLRSILHYVMRVKHVLQLPAPVLVGVLFYAQVLLKRSGYDWHRSITLAAVLACKQLFEESMHLSDILFVTRRYEIEYLYAMEMQALLDATIGQIHGANLHTFRVALLSVLREEERLVRALMGGSLGHGFGTDVNHANDRRQVMIVDQSAAERDHLESMLHLIMPGCEVTACATLAEVRDSVRARDAWLPDLLLVEPRRAQNQQSDGEVVAEVLGVPLSMNEGRPLIAAVTSAAGGLSEAETRDVDIVLPKPLSGDDLRMLLAICW